MRYITSKKIMTRQEIDLCGTLFADIKVAKPAIPFNL